MTRTRDLVAGLPVEHGGWSATLEPVLIVIAVIAVIAVHPG